MSFDYGKLTFNILKHIPFADHSDWYNFLKSKDFKKRALSRRIKDYLIISYSSSILGFIFGLPLAALFAVFLGGTNLLFGLIMLLLLPLLFLILNLSNGVLYFIFLKLVGGKGSLKDTLGGVFLASTTTNALFMLPQAVVSIINIPIIGLLCIRGPMKGIAIIYSVYLTLLALEKIHKINRIVLLVAIALPIMIFMIILAYLGFNNLPVSL